MNGKFSDAKTAHAYARAQSELRKYAKVTDLSNVPSETDVFIDPEGYERACSILNAQWTSTKVGGRSPLFWEHSGVVEMEAVYTTGFSICSDNVDPRLLADEKKEYAKCGAFFEQPASMMIDATLQYLAPQVDTEYYTSPMRDDVIRHAKQIGKELREAYGGYAEPISAEKAVEVMPKDTHFGAPYFTSQYYDPERDGFGEKLEDAMMVSDLIVAGELPVDTLNQFPVIVFERVVPAGRYSPVKAGGEPSGYAGKARRTFAGSKYEAVLAKRYSLPILDALKNTSFGIFYRGNNDPEARESIQSAIAHADHVLSLDYSQFDQCARNIAREAVLVCLQEFFTPDSHHGLQTLNHHYSTSGILTPYGYVSNYSDVGLLSGFGLTGIEGTVYNIILQRCFFERVSSQYNFHLTGSFAYGDDSLVSWKGDFVPMDVWERLGNEYGMIINSAKQELGSYDDRFGTFLQKRYYFVPNHSKFSWCRDDAFHTQDGMVTAGVHPLMRVLPRLIFKDITKDQEDPFVRAARSGLDSLPFAYRKAAESTLDVVSNLEEAKYHPHLNEFVEYVAGFHPTGLDPRFIIDYERISNRIENKGSRPTHGLEYFTTFRVLTKLWKEHIASSPVASPSHEFVEWVGHKLTRFHDLHVKKGYNLTDDQLRDYVVGTTVELTSDQVAQACAWGQHKGVTLEERVVRLQKKKGVRLNVTQVTAMRKGHKVVWTEAQTGAMAKFGVLSDAEKRDSVERLDLTNVAGLLRKDRVSRPDPVAFHHSLNIVETHVGCGDHSVLDVSPKIGNYRLCVSAHIDQIKEKFLQVDHKGLKEVTQFVVEARF